MLHTIRSDDKKGTKWWFLQDSDGDKLVTQTGRHQEKHTKTNLVGVDAQTFMLPWNADRREQQSNLEPAYRHQ